MNEEKRQFRTMPEDPNLDTGEASGAKIDEKKMRISITNIVHILLNSQMHESIIV